MSMRGFDDIEARQNGMAIPPQLYQTEPSMSTFHDILAQGASIVVRHIHFTVPPIQWLAAAIERQLGFAVGVNAYLSFSKGGAFNPHWDGHDVLVVQVHGKKTWRLWDATVTNPIEQSRYAKHDITGPASEELELSSGDVLYIPRGEPHAASVSPVSGDGSVHLTIGLDSLTGVNVLEQLGSAAGQDEFLRSDLPQQGAEAQLRDYEAELKTRLHRLVDGLDISALLRESDANRPPIRQVSLVSSEEPTDILRLTLRRRVPLPEGPSPGSAWTGGESPPVTIGGAAYSLSPAAIEVLRRLFASDCQSRGDLTEALSSRHERSAVASGLRELSRLGFLMTDRPV